MAERKETAIREMFAQIAPTYDLLNTILSLNLHARWRRVAVRAACLAPGGRVLDLATGTADLALTARRAVGPTGLVLGADNCEPMVRAGQRKLARRGEPIPLLLGRADELPFADGVFDAVMMAFALRNVPDPEHCLAEMARVTRPGGWVVNLELTRPLRRWMAPLYRFYQNWLMPTVGGWISGRREAYTYLPRSIQEFASPAAVGAVFERVGLAEVSWQALSLGLATVHRGRKP